jgi:hypothetical protein
MASHCIDSSGLSSLRLTVQHSGDRSFGWIDPSEYLPQLPGITRPARPEQRLHRLGRADQPGVLVELREEERHKNAQVLDVMPERGSSTVLGKNRSNLAGSPPGPAWLRPTATAACARPGPPAARPAAHAAAGY